MPIRHLVLALPLVACLDAPEPTTSERQDDIVCTPLCDVGYRPELETAYGYGYALFPGARSTEASCADIGTTAPQWDCVVTFVSPANPCGTYVVECVQGYGLPHCSWLNPTNCP